MRHESLPEPEALPRCRSLPDPLRMRDGTPVRKVADWRDRRGPELRQLFQHYMYGYLPPAPRHVQARVAVRVPRYLGGRATLEEVVLRFGPAGAPPIRLLVVLPRPARRPVPLFLGLNFFGNHAQCASRRVAMPAWVPDRFRHQVRNRPSESGRNSMAGRFPLDLIVSRGYGVAMFYHGDVDPDRPDFSDGIHPHYFAPGQTAPRPTDWGTLAAWAWGLHRAVDYLVTRSDVAWNRIAVVGHSRNGKAALLAAAFDERIALAIPHQAGCGGTAPSRGRVGESVEQINTAFPHWFNDMFPRFSRSVDRLPFDQHALVALCAPRPVLFSNATLDTWANPAGQFAVLQAASPVYRLLGVEGLGVRALPPVNRLVASRLGYSLRPGRHSMGRQDWKVFLRFADRWL